MAASQQEASHAPEIELLGISKQYGGAWAVRDVSLCIKPGTVHAIVGENGAGKSTLGKILSGTIRADSGEIRFDGQIRSFRAPRDALAAGVATIAQEIAVVPKLTVADNVFLGIEPRRLGMLRRRSVRRDTDALGKESGLDLPVAAAVEQLRMADQQKTEILRVLARKATTVIMDEPTAVLSRADAERFYRIVRQLRSRGCTIILISHFLADVLNIADTVTVLRNGRHVRTGPVSGESENSLIEAMIGRSVQNLYPTIPAPAADAPVVLDVQGLSAPGVSDASLSVRAGEVVGLAGLVGSGRSELAMAIYGAARRSGGRVLAADKIAIKSLRQAHGAGIFLVPESRKEQGLLLRRSITENVTLGNLSRITSCGLIRAGRERRAAEAAMQHATVRAQTADMMVSALSGGNQQKVLFARAQLAGITVLIADEPTRGVDVGSRQTIYNLVRQMAVDGVGVLLISSDLEEVLGLSHRVLVMRNGRLVTDLAGTERTAERVLSAALTESASDRSEARE